MRRPLCAALTLFVFSYGYLLGAQPVEALFSTPVDAIQVKLPPLNAPLVLRQRLVNIRFDLLADGEKATVNLNLFDDVQVIAVRERTERNSIEGYAWDGRGEGGASGTYSGGTNVTLTATPDVGWQFSGWSGDLQGSASPASITMNADKGVTATFTEVGNNNPSGGGSSGGGGGGCLIATRAICSVNPRVA